MFTILLHSSKTMRAAETASGNYQVPRLIKQATLLAQIAKSMSLEELSSAMHISNKKAESVAAMYADWSAQPSRYAAAIDSFVGDIYSGLRAAAWSRDDRDYANETLVILSGLYGGLRALDSIIPYRLEMGYKLQRNDAKNLYDFWSDSIVKLLPCGRTIINTSSAEYTKALLPYCTAARVITPKFLTINSKTGEPTFVTVHTKIARGAFACWLIVNRVAEESQLCEFHDLGYTYDPVRSTPTEPVFVCQDFGGLGLSVRTRA